MTDVVERAWKIARDLNEQTERLNRSIAELERVARERKFPPRSTIVNVKNRQNVFAWDVTQFLWNGYPLRNTSRHTRMTVVEYFAEVIHR